VTGTSGPSPETLQAIHRAELAMARRQFLWSALFLCLFAGVAAVFGSVRSMGSTLVLGVGLFATITAALEWRKLASVDLSSPEHARAAAAQADAAEAWAARDAEQLVAHPARLTPALVIAIALIAVLQFLTGGIGAAVDAAGLVKPAARAGQWWRLLTGTYLHGSLVHLLGNLSALSAAGRYMEAYVPRSQVLLVYFLAALSGSVASLVLLPNTPSVGASGGIVGLFGYLLILARRRRTEVPPYLQAIVFSTLGLAACVGVFGFALIDNAGHVGGALAGILVGRITIPRTDQPFSHVSSTADRLGWVAGAVLLIGALFAAEQLIAAQAGRRAAAVAAIADEGMTPIRSVTARVIGSTPTSITVALQNLRDVPLEAWQIDAYARAGDTQPIGSIIVDACCARAMGEVAPIAAHESRSLLLNRPAASRAFVASVRLVMFGDLSFEGSRRDRDAVLRRREQMADKLAKDLGDLRRESSSLDPAVRQRIATLEAQRAALLRHQTAPPPGR
jgi:membrane associated rhomboid family serine protease